MHYLVLNNSIVLNYSGKTVVISNTDKRYNAVLSCIKNQDLEGIPEVVEIERAFNGTGLELKDGVLYESNNPIPVELNKRILDYKEQGLPYDSLLKFWENLKANPSFNARLMLFKFLEHNGHPLTEDGCFIAYRGVTEDFRDVHTKQFNNNVGSVCEMPRTEVDDNPNNTCSSGLHVACHSYAKGFGSKLVEVKVNPQDVVAVPVDYNGTKMRVCKFEVVALGADIRTEALYGHTSVNASPEELEEHDDSDDDDDADECQGCGTDRDSFHNFCPDCGFEFN